MRYSLVLLVLLAGCATTPKNIIITPHIANCTTNLPLYPILMPDAEIQKLSPGRFVAKMWNERKDLITYSIEMQAATAGCL